MTRIEKTLLALALLTLLGLAASQVHDFDLFWQLQSGKYMLATKSFIYQDIFSLAADVPRHEHCWLHDILFYLAWLIGGYGAISLFKGLLVLSTAVAVMATARVRSSSWLSILCLVPLAVLLTQGGWLERPQLWSFLFTTLFILILERFRRVSDRLIFLLPFAMAAWANLHAGSALAFPILLAYLAGEGVPLLLKRSSLPQGAYKKLGLSSGLTAAAALITPYAYMLMQTMVTQVLLVLPSAGGADAPSKAMTTVYNMDWRSTTFAGDPYFFYALGVAAVLLLLGWRRLTLTDLLLVGGMAFMGLKLSRHTTFYFLVAAALLPVYLDAAVRPLIGRVRERTGLLLRLAAQIGAVFALFYFVWPTYQTYGFFRLGLRDWHYPVEAARFVREHKLPPNLYNTYDWGGYLMWTLYPDYRVFWDGRSDSAEMFRLGWEAMAGHPEWEQIFDRFDVRTVVTKACLVDTGQHYPIIDRLRESPDWALVFADDSSMIFVRRSAVDSAWLERHRLPDSRIDDTILSEANLLLEVDNSRYKAYWEAARVYLDRRQYPEAYHALANYLARTPAPDPLAESYYRTLYPMFEKKQD